MLFTFVSKPTFKRSTFVPGKSMGNIRFIHVRSFRSLVRLFVVLWQRKGRVNYALSSYIGAMFCVSAAVAVATDLLSHYLFKCERIGGLLRLE